MRRGEIRVIHSRITNRDQHALIIGNDSLNESEATAWVITTPVDTAMITPETLVTVRIDRPVAGLVRLDNVTSVRKDRVGDLVGRVTPDTMESVNVALRAALDV